MAYIQVLTHMCSSQKITTVLAGICTALEEDSGYYSSQVVSEPKNFTGLAKKDKN